MKEQEYIDATNLASARIAWEAIHSIETSNQSHIGGYRSAALEALNTIISRTEKRLGKTVVNP